jgi:hypothetical protein
MYSKTLTCGFTEPIFFYRIVRGKAIIHNLTINSCNKDLFSLMCYCVPGDFDLTLVDMPEVCPRCAPGGFV